MKLLVVEDEKKLLENVAAFLERKGFLVDTAQDAEDGLDLALERNYDCIILDVILPGMGGYEFCRFLREEIGSDVPIIIITALGEIDSRIKGLKIGADDYLPKPFDLRELEARVRALIRRNQLRSEPVIRYGPLTYDSRSGVFSCSKKELSLTSRESSILELFLRNPGTVFSREEITDKIWETGFESRSNIVDVYIRYIRRKLEAAGILDIIQTVPGKGYGLRRMRDDG
ncbi:MULTISPECIES: response regulator transcription factor [Mesotoga]|jgi:DNA-binding response OmpR family regulator|uniref:response regulator transcription factor n=1 Tax=Mesotoga TaxID=1184396 RepID=UPI0002CA580D|nr:MULTISPECIES: response regulator transcription factor [Mesotoga]MCB1222987.1 response regulator transcription factor [Mesotoga sp.]CCU83959.1 Two component transcriptional regulator, winged helix family [Mesotoga infera]RLL81821.1 transcriptional regulator [Mesotoga sp. H07pep.5.4]HOZ99952.1 response regulator transcription factor [Mesotoga prima]HQN60204.1 response regulator transcription factor [Mesotoga prima]